MFYCRRAVPSSQVTVCMRTVLWPKFVYLFESLRRQVSNHEQSKGEGLALDKGNKTKQDKFECLNFTLFHDFDAFFTR